jgi:hypothetical protein
MGSVVVILDIPTRACLIGHEIEYCMRPYTTQVLTGFIWVKLALLSPGSVSAPIPFFYIYKKAPILFERPMPLMKSAAMTTYCQSQERSQQKN